MGTGREVAISYTISRDVARGPVGSYAALMPEFRRAGQGDSGKVQQRMHPAPTSYDQLSPVTCTNDQHRPPCNSFTPRWSLELRAYQCVRIPRLGPAGLPPDLAYVVEAYFDRSPVQDAVAARSDSPRPGADP
jgi:hypothetical protein